MASRIISIGTAVPEYGTRQNAILGFMHGAYKDATASRKLNALFNYSGINTRYSAIADFDNPESDASFFDKNYKAAVDIRLAEYRRKALPLAMEAVDAGFRKLNSSAKDFGITHLITVSCTGMYAPGIDVELIEQLELPSDIFRTCVNFMGCNAAFHALKIADMIVQSEINAKVLIVCVELCTLHFQPKNNHDYLLSNTVFGDGAAAVVVTSSVCADEQGLRGFNVNGFYSTLLHKGKDLMGWNITPVSFEMILDAKIPDFIGEQMGMLLEQSSRKYNMDVTTVSGWAIHPGGKKILDTVQNKLQLDKEKMQYSYEVLQKYGNMSSPTILFVLHELLNAYRKNDTVFSIGFGPGISIETALLSYA
jgi:predicted naringenin-chalcone synthase